MRGHGQKLTSRQERLIAALLAEPTYEAAARAAGISPATLYRWLELPAFQDAYRKARQQVLDRTAARLLAGSSQAVDRLLKNLGSKNAAVANRAALAILERALKSVETLDILHRLEELERRDAGRRARESSYAYNRDQPAA